jgi:hypothetical protein
LTHALLQNIYGAEYRTLQLDGFAADGLAGASAS